MKINLVCIEDRLMGIGFRKMASYIRSFNQSGNNYFITSTEPLTVKRIVTGAYGAAQEYSDETLRNMAETLAKADIIGFSSYSSHAEITKRLLKEIKILNRNAYIVWGGIHPIIVPDDAIEHADAICTGEGEFAFEQFFDAFKQGSDYTKTQNFWFKENGEIIKNGFLPLMKPEEMGELPLLPEKGQSQDRDK